MFFCEFWEIFKNTFFAEKPPGDCFCNQLNWHQSYLIYNGVYQNLLLNCLIFSAGDSYKPVTQHCFVYVIIFSMEATTIYFGTCSRELLFSLLSLCEKCPYSEFLWSVFSRIQTEYREMQSKCRKLRTRETLNTDTFHAVTTN